MKRLLLVLLVLGLSVPAMADMFVYNLKQSGVEFEYDGGVWTQPKPTLTSFIVIQADSSSPDDVNIWNIDTWKEKDPDTGETIKYYTVSGPSTVNIVETLIGKKNMWIVEGILDDSFNTHILLSGQVKSAKIGSRTYTVATAMSGCVISGSIASQSISGGPISMTLNSKITNALIASGEDIDIAISDYFENVLGYEPG